MNYLLSRVDMCALMNYLLSAVDVSTDELLLSRVDVSIVLINYLL